MLRFHSQTAGSTLTAQQPENNIVRVAYQAMAAVLGGTQSLHTNGMDEALSLPTEKTATIALRTQQVLAHETGVADTVDPLGGAPFIEALTDALEKNAYELIEQVDGMGGMVHAIERGFPQRCIQDAAYAAQLAVDRQESLVVGVNAFDSNNSEMPPTHRLDKRLEEEQKKRTAQVRAERSAAEASHALIALEKAAKETDNLMPHILHAVRKMCTVGEIADTMRGVFGEHREIRTLS